MTNHKPQTEPGLDDHDAQSSIQLLSFEVGEQQYAIKITSVREICGWTETTTLPQAPHFVQGVINLRGTVLPVLDLALCLGQSSSDPQTRDVIIVVETSGQCLGLRVNAVSDILTIPNAAISAPPDVASGPAGALIKALTMVDDVMIRILDVNNVLQDPQEDAA